MNPPRIPPRAMRRTLAVVAAIATLLVLPTAPAGAAEPETITFEGAGWGHGVGMSQYGAYARAQDGGQGYQQILTDYYQGASVGQLGVDGIPAIASIHTNVASDIGSTVLSVANGPASGPGLTVTRITGGETPPTAVLTTGDRVTITDTTYTHGEPDGCAITVTVDGVDTDWGTGVCDVTVDLAGSASPAYLIEATNCRRTNDCTYGFGTAFRVVDNGSSQRSVPDRDGPSGCGGCPVWRGFDLVVEASPDDYTRGIAEVPFSWPTEALKTQAVAARSYASSFAASTDHTAMGCFCDVKNDSSWQVFAGWVLDRQMSSAWDAAAVATNGEVMTHWAAPDSGIVRAYYSSSNGGASEWVKDKWGSEFPYLVSVPDAWSLTPANPRGAWEFTFDIDTVVDRVWSTSSENRLIAAEVIATNTSGSAKTIRFTALTPEDQETSKTLSVGTVASMFGLYSWYFDIDDSGTEPPSGVPSGAASVGTQDPRTGIWTLRSPNGNLSTFYYGDPNDEPFIGDWNGDGIETVGLYRRSVGFLFIRNSNTQGVADIDIYYGIPGDVPIAGDWNGDGTQTIGVYRPSETTFYLRNSNTAGFADVTVKWGNPGDQPIAGDWDGDGVDTIGIYRPSTEMVYLANSLAAVTDFAFHYDGTIPGDKVIAGDWDGDGDDTLGVFRPSNATFYLRDTYAQSNANVIIPLGNSWMNPISGYWGG